EDFVDFLTNLDNPQVRGIVANNSAVATAAAIEGGDFFFCSRGLFSQATIEGGEDGDRSVSSALIMATLAHA
ncbi:unnamed protein product, partial [Symbiodinium pilosum]